MALPESLLIYCQLGPEDQTSVKFVLKKNHFSFRKRHLWTLCTKCFKASVSLWPSDAIQRYKYLPTMAQVMACCLTAPSHYLNQYWLLIDRVQWHSPEGSNTRLKITSLKFNSKLPGANELTCNQILSSRGYPAKRALPAMLTHGR